jgi:hypothetical protein
MRQSIRHPMTALIKKENRAFPGWIGVSGFRSACRPRNESVLPEFVEISTSQGLVAQVSEPAVSPISKSAARRQAEGAAGWKPATQTWESALDPSRSLQSPRSWPQCAVSEPVRLSVNPEMVERSPSPKSSPPGEDFHARRVWSMARSRLFMGSRRILLRGILSFRQGETRSPWRTETHAWGNLLTFYPQTP